MESLLIEVSKPYEVLIGRGLLADANLHLEPYLKDRKVLIVTDSTIERLGYADRLIGAIDPLGASVHQIVLPSGEAQKNMDNVVKLTSHLAELHFSREDVLIALGGGVIGDLVGFTASIYLRGINYIQIPTTFLAAIDSSVGGKTAVDIPQGKNLIGAFYHPTCVMCDVSLFESLPQRIFEDGCSELIKYAMIMNPVLLHKLMERKLPLTATDSDLPDIVKECVTMKRNVVVEDEFDQGLRQLLNFGHTLGHALEQRSHYSISHGRGVAVGMAVFTEIAIQQGFLTEDFSNALSHLLSDYHLLDDKPDFTTEELIEVMLNDKKRRRQQMTVVLPKEFGYCTLVEVDVSTFQQWFKEEWDRYEVLK